MVKYELFNKASYDKKNYISRLVGTIDLDKELYLKDIIFSDSMINFINNNNK
jgi:hypothetical protein